MNQFLQSSHEMTCKIVLVCLFFFFPFKALRSFLEKVLMNDFFFWVKND